MNLSRRGFMAASGAALATRGVGIAAKTPKTKVILKLVYDHSKGMMRAVEKVIKL
ncbi:twin-arginine translocation signal domain-containing protein [Algirhabdus cladophorae]|uniref:twin-arginine translocation signal domain-containing protein n=1 Tax=Algirhabdus cladophorae TaxID=3377108 RepID=UPI003B8493F6